MIDLTLWMPQFLIKENPNILPSGNRFGFLDIGAGGRTRTGTLSPAVDFESTTSANSITPAGDCHLTAT